MGYNGSLWVRMVSYGSMEGAISEHGDDDDDRYGDDDDGDDGHVGLGR